MVMGFQKPLRRFALVLTILTPFAAAAHQFGCDVVLASPPGFALPKGPETTDDLEAALTGADIVYAKSWGCLNYYGRWDE
jgi:ornithine carbamoyltransferase